MPANASRTNPGATAKLGSSPVSICTSGRRRTERRRQKRQGCQSLSLNPSATTRHSGRGVKVSKLSVRSTASDEMPADVENMATKAEQGRFMTAWDYCKPIFSSWSIKVRTPSNDVPNSVWLINTVGKGLIHMHVAERGDSYPCFYCARSFTEPYLDSGGMFKDAVIAILGAIAKQERVRLSERVRAD
jgi:hypothetical protein